MTCLGQQGCASEGPGAQAAEPATELTHADLVQYFGDGDNDPNDGDMGHEKLTKQEAFDLHYHHRAEDWTPAASDAPAKGACYWRERKIVASDGTLTTAGTNLENNDWSDEGTKKQAP